MQTYLNERQSKWNGRKFRIKLYFWALAAGLAGLGGFYLILYSPIFQIKEFKIIGRERLSKEEVVEILEPMVLKSRLDNFLGPKNLLVWGKSGLNTDKTALAGAVLDRDWLRQNVVIKIKERERLAIWCGQNEDCYWIDPDGLIFQPAPATEGVLVLTIHEDGDIIQGNKAIDGYFAKNLNIILETLLELKLPIRKISFARKLMDLKAELYSGPDLLFNVRFDPTLNLASLKSLQEKSSLKRMLYIDLRSENRLYYKTL